MSAEPQPQPPRIVLEIGAPRWFWGAIAGAALLWGLGALLSAPPRKTAAEVLREQAVLDAAHFLRQVETLRSGRDSALDRAIDSILARAPR